jgi:hypothetical protein
MEGQRTEESGCFACFEGLRDFVFLLMQGEGFVAIECNFTDTTGMMYGMRLSDTFKGSSAYRFVPPRSRARNVLR